MAEIGQVIEVKGEKVVVILERTEACAKCRACTEGFSKNEMLIEAINLCDAKVDDFVELALENSNFLKAVLIMYFIPLLALFAGFALGYIGLPLINLANFRELGGFFLGILFMLLSYFIIRKNEHRFKNKKYIPYVSNIVNKDI